MDVLRRVHDKRTKLQHRFVERQCRDEEEAATIWSGRYFDLVAIREDKKPRSGQRVSIDDEAPANRIRDGRSARLRRNFHLTTRIQLDVQHRRTDGDALERPSAPW